MWQILENAPHEKRSCWSFNFSSDLAQIWLGFSSSSFFCVSLFSCPLLRYLKYQVKDHAIHDCDRVEKWWKLSIFCGVQDENKCWDKISLTFPSCSGASCCHKPALSSSTSSCTILNQQIRRKTWKIILTAPKQKHEKNSAQHAWMKGCLYVKWLCSVFERFKCKILFDPIIGCWP